MDCRCHKCNETKELQKIEGRLLEIRVMTSKNETFIRLLGINDNFYIKKY